MVYSLGREGVVCGGMGVGASVGGQGVGCDLGVGCGMARHVKCPPDRVKTFLHEGHDAQPVEAMSMGVPS